MKKPKIFYALNIAVLSLLLSCQNAQSQNPTTNTGNSVSNGLQTLGGLSYLTRPAKADYKNPPILILMHGYGSNEQDLFELANAFPDSFVVVSVRAPITLQQNAYEWYSNVTNNNQTTPNQDEVNKSMQLMTAFIPQIVKATNANPKAVYLSGFSQGGVMSYEVGLQHPELLKGIAPLSGRLFDALKPSIKNNQALKSLRIFIGHGDADNRVPYVTSTEADNYLKSLGLSPDYHTYKGMTHSINQEELKDLISWITK